MRIPKSVVILGRKFTVKNNLSPEAMRRYVPGENIPLGAMNYSRKLILIQAHHCKEEQIVTYIHECLHVMQYVSGLAQVTNGDVAEVWCESGANAMLDVFKSLK